MKKARHLPGFFLPVDFTLTSSSTTHFMPSKITPTHLHWHILRSAPGQAPLIITAADLSSLYRADKTTSVDTSKRLEANEVTSGNAYPHLQLITNVQLTAGVF